MFQLSDRFIVTGLPFMAEPAEQIIDKLFSAVTPCGFVDGYCLFSLVGEVILLLIVDQGDRSSGMISTSRSALTGYK